MNKSCLLGLGGGRVRVRVLVYSFEQVRHDGWLFGRLVG